MKTTRVTVISHRGELVATYIPPQEPKNSAGPTARLVAGPGQRSHEPEIEEAETYHTRGAVGELHKIIKKRLKLK
jgi:hypothetical protein